jgi:hypothetical protein
MGRGKVARGVVLVHSSAKKTLKTSAASLSSEPFVVSVIYIWLY